jgi:hypothetical protein
LTGSGFASGGAVEIVAGHIGTPPFLATTNRRRQRGVRG